METREHSLRVATLSDIMAYKLNLDMVSRVELTTAALLHDVGKSALKTNILLKSEPLTEKEFLYIQKHPVFSYKILAQVGLTNKNILSGVLQHHENWDGTGYNQGLIGNEISFYARIIRITDVYDSLRSERCYKKALPKTKCIEYLQNNSGVLFDPDLIDKFIDIIQYTDSCVYK